MKKDQAMAAERRSDCSRALQCMVDRALTSVSSRERRLSLASARRAEQSVEGDGSCHTNGE